MARALAAWVLFAMISWPQTAQTPFRGGVELVAVDFLAVGGDGRPVADLRPSDLTLTVDGRTRSITDLQFVRVATDETTERTVVPGKPVPPPFSTNRVTETGRTIIFLFDDNSIRPGNEQGARDAAARFLDRLAPADRVAVATAARIEVDLTTNRERVRSALASIVGHGAAGTNPDATTRPTGTAIPQAGPTLAWLRTFLDGLKAIDGPKTVIMIAESTPSIMRSDGVPDPSVASDYKDIGKAAGAARAQLYLIQPHNFAIDASQTSGDVGRTSQSTGIGHIGAEAAKLEGLQDLATVSGGEFFRLTAGVDTIYEHIVRETSAYYLLGFQPEAAERNGKSHRIAVEARRPGVVIRARPEFTIPKAGADAAAAKKLTLPDMLKDRAVYRDVPLRAAAYTLRSAPNGMVNVVVVAESADPNIAIASAAFGLIDTNLQFMALAWPAPAEAVTDARVATGGVVPPGTYRLRVAVLSKDGRRGTADYEFTASVTSAPPIEMSDLMIGQGQPDGSFQPQLDLGDRAAATGYLELNGSLPVGTALSVAFELARSADGPALAVVPGIVGPTEAAGRLAARGAIPIGGAPPGDYVLRAIVKVNGAAAGKAVRALRKGR